MAGEREGFNVEVLIRFNHRIGLDPETTPPGRLALINTLEVAYVCESLFWVVEQLGMVGTHGGWVYEQEALFRALERIGQIGQAFASASADEADKLVLLHTTQANRPE